MVRETLSTLSFRINLLEDQKGFTKTVWVAFVVHLRLEETSACLPLAHGLYQLTNALLTRDGGFERKITRKTLTRMRSGSNSLVQPNIERLVVCPECCLCLSFSLSRSPFVETNLTD